MQLNKNTLNIHQPPVLLSSIGVKIALAYDREGSPDRLFKGNQKNKVILRSDRHGNSEEMLRETKYE